jgi:LacI family transcriptional regulator
MVAPPTPRPKRVALYFPLRLGPWADIVRGVYRYADAEADWAVSLNTEEDPAVALAGNPDGVIAMLRTPAAAARFRAWGGPLVDTAYDLDGPPVARVCLDPLAIGRAAAEHLLTLPGRHFGYVGDPATPAGRLTREGFVGRLAEAGCGCTTAPPGEFDRPYHVDPAGERAAAAWLASRPRPGAVLAAHNALAHRLAGACRAAGLAVPGDIALLGVLNDEFLCTASQPPLSSVRCPLPAVGFEAARVLAGMMAGGPAAGQVEFAPLGVAVRQSTDPAAVADPEVGAALRFIRDHAAERIGVDQVAAASGLSRSTLERRFRAVLGRSPLAELLRERVDRARHLLAATDLPVKRVARAAGFGDARHLSATFRQKTGLSPTAYRAKVRPG